MIATIRYLATCPCPQCFTMKTRAGALGTRVDDQRRSHSRVDTPSRQRKVETTQKCIFEQGRGVNSKAVNDILQEDSYTPTRVSLIGHYFHESDCFYPRTHSQQSYSTMDSTFSQCLCPIFCMISSSVCGNQFLRTFCAFFMLLGIIVFKVSTGGALFV